MYIAITRQHMGGNFKGSVRDFVQYLEKENEGKDPNLREYFFNHQENQIDPAQVIVEIDANTAKLHKKDPKFYSIMVSPSKRELGHIGDDPEKLRAYTRDLMKSYADAFFRDAKIKVDDILYFAKLERQRTFSSKNREVLENQVYASQILNLQHQIRKIERGETQGNINNLTRKIEGLEREAPHRQNGKRIVPGMTKDGHQSHIHIIVSRKDVSNSFSLSPGSNFRKSITTLNEKEVKQGFDRDQFYRSAEKKFDQRFNYRRNFVETYHAKNLLDKNPGKFFKSMLALPSNERQVAAKLLGKAGIEIPNIPTTKAQLAYKALGHLKKGIGKALESGSIGI